jgi:hypothetical protein
MTDAFRALLVQEGESARAVKGVRGRLGYDECHVRRLVVTSVDDSGQGRMRGRAHSKQHAHLLFPERSTETAKTSEQLEGQRSISLVQHAISIEHARCDHRPCILALVGSIPR